jgi:hypothetical protein
LKAPKIECGVLPIDLLTQRTAERDVTAIKMESQEASATGGIFSADRAIFIGRG